MNKAFTLSEVLITLGIIGVVAALTLPAIVNNTNNKTLETSLKKSYSTIYQALNIYYAQNGEKITPENIGAHELKPILLKYMDVIDSEAKSVDDKTYKNYTGTSYVNRVFFYDGQFILKDGSLILLRNAGGNQLFISVDINGPNKRPNQLGHDLFMFEINTKGELVPMGAKETIYYNINDTWCSSTSTNAMNGAACTIKAVNEKDYFKKLL